MAAGSMKKVSAAGPNQLQLSVDMYPIILLLVNLRIVVLLSTRLRLDTLGGDPSIMKQALDITIKQPFFSSST